MTTRQDLVKIKSRAMRTRVWFRALSKIDRSIIDLTIKCVQKVQSSVLVATISRIIDKILQSLEGAFMTLAKNLGVEIAEKLCVLGEKWGNAACSAWRYDKRFIRFLGVNALNT